MEKKKLWFRAKYYGWGWFPATWEGWFVTLGGTALFACSYALMDLVTLTDAQVLVWIISSVTGLTFFLLYFGVTRGEKPRWRWGK